MVEGSPSNCPAAWSCWLRQYLVKSGMFRLSVAQKPTMAVSCGKKIVQNDTPSSRDVPLVKSVMLSSTATNAQINSATPHAIRNGAA